MACVCHIVCRACSLPRRLTCGPYVDVCRYEGSSSPPKPSASRKEPEEQALYVNDGADATPSATREEPDEQALYVNDVANVVVPTSHQESEAVVSSEEGQEPEEESREENYDVVAPAEDAMTRAQEDEDANVEPSATVNSSVEEMASHTQEEPDLGPYADVPAVGWLRKDIHCIDWANDGWMEATEVEDVAGGGATVNLDSPAGGVALRMGWVDAAEMTGLFLASALGVACVRGRLVKLESDEGRALRATVEPLMGNLGVAFDQVCLPFMVPHSLCACMHACIWGCWCV